MKDNFVNISAYGLVHPSARIYINFLLFID